MLEELTISVMSFFAGFGAREFLLYLQLRKKGRKEDQDNCGGKTD